VERIVAELWNYKSTAYFLLIQERTILNFMGLYETGMPIIAVSLANIESEYFSIKAMDRKRLGDVHPLCYSRYN
jgi:hypothetical protein